MQLSRAKLIWTPDHDAHDLEIEVEEMFLRAEATQAMLDGSLALDSYLDFIDSQQIDPFDLVDLWEETGEIVI